MFNMRFEIKQYEAMTKLNLPEPERAWVTERAEKLLESLCALEEINTDGVEPLVSVLELTNVLREDVTAKTITREKLLSNAPEQYDGYFQVPKTVD